MRVGIIGTGPCAHTHTRALLSNDQVLLAYIASSDLTSAKSFCCQYEGLRPLTCSDLINSEDLDAVITAIPPHAQPNIAKKLFNSGKHILCEKPLAVDLQSALDIAETYRCSNQVGMINYCYRYIPEIQLLKEELNAHIEKKQDISVRWLLPNRLDSDLTFHWKGQKEMGGGVLRNFGTHVLDYLFHDLTPEIISIKKGIETPFRPDEQGKKRKVTGEEWIAIEAEVGKTHFKIELSLVSNSPVGHEVTLKNNKGYLTISNNQLRNPGGNFTLASDYYNYEPIPVRQECLDTRYQIIHRRFFEAITKNLRTYGPSIDDAVRTLALIENIENEKTNTYRESSLA